MPFIVFQYLFALTNKQEQALVIHTTNCFNYNQGDTMLWLHFIYTVLLYSQMFAATFSMAYFTMIANLEFTEIPIKHYCCISQINCGSNCDTDEGCLAFNYNRGTNACRLFNCDLFNQIAWPEFVLN